MYLSNEKIKPLPHPGSVSSLLLLQEGGSICANTRKTCSVACSSKQRWATLPLFFLKQSHSDSEAQPGDMSLDELPNWDAFESEHLWQTDSVQHLHIRHWRMEFYQERFMFWSIHVFRCWHNTLLSITAKQPGADSSLWGFQSHRHRHGHTEVYSLIQTEEQPKLCLWYREQYVATYICVTCRWVLANCCHCLCNYCISFATLCHCEGVRKS